MKPTETLQPEQNEQNERSNDEIFDTAAAEMGHYALLNELYTTDAQLEELYHTSKKREKAMNAVVKNSNSGPQATRNREVAYSFRAERAERTTQTIADLEQKKQGIEAVFDTPNAIDVNYTPSSVEIQVLHPSKLDDADHYDHAA